MARFAVLGATSWGLTLAWLLNRTGNQVLVVTRSAAEADAVMRQRGLARLPELLLPEAIAVVAPPAPSEVDGVVVAVPARAVRTTLEAAAVSRQTPVLLAAKGVEAQAGRPSRLLSETLGECGWSPELVAVISGPNLAHEVVRGLPAAAVVAAWPVSGAERWQTALSGGMFRVYSSDDVAGVELAAALKNVIAIAAGAAWGLEFGANAVSMILTRGLAEMTRLGVAMGASPATFQGLAGVGDLAATCFSPLSRNRRFGERLGRGETPDSAAAAIGETIEGARTAAIALEFGARYGVELPICATVAAVVGGQQTVMEAMAKLLARPLKPEAAWPS
ncbi:MAG: NAD(P)H-dependent glycerol-3-phosphate dehydrogenase [Dehalococcoidia bacterium]|nr:NAD(P)H-dependent glycerol-3-phosphate dehydrogenase [Dehalococcoidia bacterium]